MKIALYFVLALTFTISAMASGDLPPHRIYSSHQDLGFVAKGRLTAVEFFYQGGAFGKLLIFSADDGTPLVVDGSLSSLEQVLRSALPEGATDDFLKNHMAAALLAMATNGRTYVIDQKVIDGFGRLKLEGKSRVEMRAALQVVRPPVVKSSGGSWELKFNYFTADGRIYEASYTGEKQPFSIGTNTIKTIEGQIPPGVLVAEGETFDKED